MIKNVELVIPPEKLYDKEYLYSAAAQKCGVNLVEISGIRQARRSVDARSKNPVFRISADVFINQKVEGEAFSAAYKNVSDSKKKTAIIGFGPAGMFAALRLMEEGIKPVVFERGKDIQSRRRDLRNIQQEGIVNPESNYCFGEGGAGTYSDGKLYTRSNKRGDVKKILNLLVQFGAESDILIDAHPHIGSNKLPLIVKSVREKIIEFGGEVRFNSRITNLIIKNGKVAGVVINDDYEFETEAVIMATGHSARDAFFMLRDNGLKLEAKPFAMGVRIEHPQELIDGIQYHSGVRPQNLPAASYNLNCQVEGKGVFSFCMCPGGIIVPASTAPGELVLNGMSVSGRNSKFANSGFVVEVNEKDWGKFNSHGEFAGLMLQKELEVIAFKAGGLKLKAPAQRITDFVNRKLSANLPQTSYIPGAVSAELHEILPAYISKKLSAALVLFGKQKKGYYTAEAQILAAESRTSSPVRVIRDKETLMHPQSAGLFPAGEGAGYAGGIVSAAIDGENCAEACVRYLS
jgi:uncharacterized FAD-dependent dehydrogenase